MTDTQFKIFGISNFSAPQAHLNPCDGNKDYDTLDKAKESLIGLKCNCKNQHIIVKSDRIVFAQ